MSLTVDATYENCILRLAAPLPLEEQQRVRVTVQPEASGSKAVSLRHEPARINSEPGFAPPEDKPSDFAEYEMVDLWLEIPPSPDAITVIARRGPLPLPDPPIIPPWDDEIE